MTVVSGNSDSDAQCAGITPAVIPSGSTTARNAQIEIMQLPNNYWRCTLSVKVPGHSPIRESGDLFHDAGECLDWANFTLRSVVAAATGWL